MSILNTIKWFSFVLTEVLFLTKLNTNHMVMTFTCNYRLQDYKISICCFSAKHAALRRKSKDWLALNQDNVSEWRDMSIRGIKLHHLFCYMFIAKSSIYQIRDVIEMNSRES
jgi:hypothetical protein